MINKAKRKKRIAREIAITDIIRTNLSIYFLRGVFGVILVAARSAI